MGFETPSGSSNNGCPTTPTSSRVSRSAPPSCTRMSKIRLRLKRQLDLSASTRLTYSAPGAYSKYEGLRRSRPRVITMRKGRDAPRLLMDGYNAHGGCSYFDQMYEVLQELAHGSYSTTAVVASRRQSDDRFIVKYSKEHFSEFKRGQLVTEIKNHESIPVHPNIVDFIIGWEERGAAYLMMELCELGALNGFFQPKQLIPNQTLWSFLIDILFALQHLHSLGLVHCDLKPANIMLTHDYVCKLGDFGLLYSIRRVGSIDTNTDENEGDGKYLAPESFNGYITTGTDMFSLGITLLELATPHVFRDLHQSDIWSGGMPKPHLLQGVHPAFSELIHALVVTDRFKRPSAAEILASPGVQQQMTARQKSLQI